MENRLHVIFVLFCILATVIIQSIFVVVVGILHCPRVL